MDSPSFVTHEYIRTEGSHFELFARIFNALANCQSFAVELHSHDGGGKLLAVRFWTDRAEPGKQ